MRHVLVFISTRDWIPNPPADLVQDLYLREIKAYKPAVVVRIWNFASKINYNSCYESQAKDAHVGVVKKYSSPPIPKAPVLPTDLASELAAYDAAEPTIAEVAAPTNASEESGGGGAEAYLAFLEQDIPKPVHHHH